MKIARKDRERLSGANLAELKTVIYLKEPVDNPFMYSGEYLDAESGLYYLRARYYAPEIGRFINEDPAEAGFNWYVYCSNDPIMKIDPSGMVEVGLRDYAATYENSSVDWNSDTATATVTWNGKTISIKSTAQNNRNGRIYIDDSLFINKFGVGKRLIVYQDKVTGNVSIRASVYYRGSDAYAAIADSTTSDTESSLSYSAAFLEGIEEYWNGSFGKYNVSTYVRYQGDGIKTTFKGKLGVSNMSAGLFGWTTSHPGKITMYIGDSRGEEKPYSLSQFKWVSAHEFGHVLGVGDAYPNNPGLASIYNSPAFKFGVQEEDITKILNAWTSGSWQNWE